MKIQVHSGICLALLACATLIPANAQSANGSPQNSGKKQGTAQTNDANGQRKSGQVVHQDYDKVPASVPNELATLAPRLNQNSTSSSKMKVRQEFGPTQANKKNNIVAPSAASSQGGKPVDAKAQSPK